MKKTYINSDLRVIRIQNDIITDSLNQGGDKGNVTGGGPAYDTQFGETDAPSRRYRNDYDF